MVRGIDQIGKEELEAVRGPIHQDQFSPGRLKSSGDSTAQIAGRAGDNHHTI